VRQTAVAASKGPVPAPGHAAHGAQIALNRAQVTFCLYYVANGFNATTAYKAAYPGATLRSARELGHRLLTKVDIRAFLATQVNERWTELQMTGDEALARVAMAARADVRLLFDDNGHVLPPRLWPDEIAYAVEAFRFNGRGGWAIRLASRLTGLRLILEHTGRLANQRPESADALAQAIRSDIEAHARLGDSRSA
jgi:hypothetical protein